MEFKNILNVFILFASFVVCINCLDDIKQTGSLKNSPSFVVYDNCTDCWAYNRLRCMDGKCYCYPDYVWEPVGKRCINWNCYSDGDCYQSPDTHRKCLYTRCVCRFNYEEDFNNGRKCTFQLNIWTWVWVFFLIPIVLAIAFTIYCRRRRTLSSERLPVSRSSVDEPPPYQSQSVANPYRK